MAHISVIIVQKCTIISSNLPYNAIYDSPFDPDGTARMRRGSILSPYTIASQEEEKL